MPANKTLLGHAPSYKQRQDFTIAGTWVVGETITFKIGGIEFVVTVGSDVVAMIAQTIVQAWNNATMTNGSAVPEVTNSGTGGGARYIPQFDKLVGSNVSSAVFRLEGRNAGESVTFDEPPTTDSLAGTITPGALVPATGRNWLDNPDNFDANGALASGDTLLMPAGSTPYQDVKEGLDLGAIQLAAVYKSAAFTANVGLLNLNKDDSQRPYNEPRELAPKTAHDGGVGQTVFHLETGDGQGSSLFRWNCTNGKFIANVYAKGPRNDSIPCVQIVSTHADNVLNNYNGDCGIGLRPADATTLKELNNGNGAGSDAETLCGPFATLTACTIIVNGGKVTTNSALATASGSVRLLAGEHIHQAGDIKNLTVEGGNWRQRCGGALSGTLTLRGGKFDASQNFDALTPAAAIEVFEDAELDDSNATLANGTEIHLNGCDLNEVRLKIGKGRTIRIIS